MVMGILTMLIGGMMALVEADLKKVVAYSTLSQLGLIVFAIGCGEWEICFFHLLSHALFKSMLFIACGCFISLNYGAQDARTMGDHGVGFPLKRLVIGVACLSLAGYPLLGGFLSKDLIMETIVGSSVRGILYFLFLVGCVFTVGYSLKIFYGGVASGESSSPITPSVGVME